MTFTRRNALLTGPALALSAAIPGVLQAQAVPTPRRGGSVTVHMTGEQRVLNPALRASTGVYVISGKIMEALVDLDANGGPAPVLATAWNSSPDGKTITFTLRGMHCSNARKVRRSIRSSVRTRSARSTLNSIWRAAGR